MGGCIMKKGLVLPININQHIETKPFPNNTLIYSRSQIKEQYYDEAFRKISSSISNQSDRFILGKDYQWKRVSEIQKEFDVGSNITHTDVVQGLLNNHQLLNAFRIVANLQNIIERLFISLDFQPLGKYEVMINTIGIWKVQVIDDLQTTTQNQIFLIN